MPTLGMGELLVILVIVILVFGASRLPQLGDGLGKGIRSFKRAIASDDDIDVTPADKQVSGQGARSAREEVADAEVVEPTRPG